MSNPTAEVLFKARKLIDDKRAELQRTEGRLAETNERMKKEFSVSTVEELSVVIATKEQEVSTIRERLIGARDELYKLLEAAGG